jgi:putative ABC transport system substrate-binding protein
MKRVIVLTALLIVSLSTSMLFAAGAQEAATAAVPKIGVSKIITHPALDAVEKGMQDHLAAVGVDVKFDFQNANGDISTANSIAQKFKADKVSMVVGIATPVAQALANTFSDIPVIFSAVTDPLAAGLVPSYGPYTGNVAGVSDMNPVEAQIALLVRLTGAKAIGNVYASGEANGVLLNQMAADACKKLGVELVSAAVANTSEVMSATQSIVKRVGAMIIIRSDLLPAESSKTSSRMARTLAPSAPCS